MSALDVDLFGNERPAAKGAAKGTALDLFAHAAEREAIASGVPLSQAALRVKGSDKAPEGPLLGFGIKPSNTPEPVNPTRCEGCGCAIGAGPMRRCYPCRVGGR